MDTERIPSIAERTGRTAGWIIAERFSISKHSAILEYFDNPPFPMGWTLHDSLGVWYSLGNLCLMSSFYVLEKELPPEQAATMLDSGLYGLLDRWDMPEFAHKRFALFNSTKMKAVLNLWLSVAASMGDTAEMEKFIVATTGEKDCVPEVISKSQVLSKLHTFFSLFVGEILGRDMPFSPLTAAQLSSYIGTISEPVLPLLRTLWIWFLGTQKLCIEYVRSRRGLLASDIP